jgi:amidase
MRNLPTELWRWDAADLAAAIRAGVVSSREAVAACLDRIEAVNPVLNAVVLTLRDEALAAADAADRAVKAGAALGVLHGVPVTTKLNADQKGVPNSSGVVAFKDRIAPEDNVAIANLRKAGAVIIGRTNTPPFCLRWMTENELHGRTLNPWSADHVPGGSTGGGAAAVAAGMGPLTQGSDNGGSIRYPAFCTGIAGLRPTPGRVAYYSPSQAERPLSMQLIAVAGPLARRVRDLRLGLAAMASPDARDPFHVPAPLAGPPLKPPIKVALCPDPTGGGVDRTVADSLDRAAKALSDAGYVVEEPPLPSVTEAAEIWDLICQIEGREFTTAMVAELADQPMKQAIRFMMARLPDLDLKGYLELYSRRAAINRQWTTLLDEYPVLLSPVSTRPQFLHGEDILDQKANDESYRVQAPLTAFALVAIPGVAVPTGVANGLPTGVLVMAQRFREDVALDAAAIIEAHCPMPTPIDPQFGPAQAA